MSTNRTYLILAIVLLFLSVGGLILYFQLKPSTPVISEADINPPVPTRISTPIPTSIASSAAAPSISATPSAKVTQKPTSIVTPTPTLAKLSPTPTPSSTTAPSFNPLKSEANKFEVPYSSSRTLYQDKEGTGDRYTLYNSKGNFAIHVGPDWSWAHSSRQLSSAFTVAGKNTFIYEISSQKIVDFEANGLKYTLQCVHNNIDSLKKECDQLLADFKLI